MQRAREQVGANSSKTKIVFSDREWEAVQKHAISDSLLTKFLNSSDSTEIVKRAMPKASAKLSSPKLSKAKHKRLIFAGGDNKSTVVDVFDASFTRTSYSLSTGRTEATIVSVGNYALVAGGGSLYVEYFELKNQS